VVDASFAIRLILPGPEREIFRSQVERWLEEGTELRAPTLWIYEMTSALCKGAYFGLVTAEEAERALTLFLDLGIQLDPPDPVQTRRAFAWTRRLNRATAYDSFYLALAEALQCELWTADRHLCSTVELPWVPTVEECQEPGS